MRKNFLKLKKRIVGIVLGVSVFAFSVVPVFADEQENENSTLESSQTAETLTSLDNVESILPRAGTETWYGSGAGGSYTFTDYNLTPVKTMGKSGTLIISGSFRGTDGYADVSPIKLTAQIRPAYSSSAKGSTVVVDNGSGATGFAVTCSVSKGEQIQLFFDASSVANPPGIYRTAYVEYNYAII